MMSSSDSTTAYDPATRATGGLASARPGGDAGAAPEGDAARASDGVADGAGRGRGRGRGLAIVGVALLALVATVIAATATREGAGLTPDSRGYLLVAEQIHLGHGLTMLDGDGKKVPLAHAPPLYPIMLWAGDALLPGGPQASARLMNVALFALNVVLVGALAWRASGRSSTAAILAAGLTAVGLDLVLVHSMVWTEPTFLLCTFGGLYFLGKFIDRGRRISLVLSAMLCALAFATRYAGASVILAAGLLLMFGSPRRTWGQRFVDAFIHGAISCFGMFLFLLRNARSTRDADGHAFAIHLPNRSDVKNALTTVASWVVPADTSMASTPVIIAMMLFGLLVLAAALMLLWTASRNARRGRGRGDTALDGDARGDRSEAVASSATLAGPDAWGAGVRRALVWFVPVYVAFVLVSVSFFDAHVPLDRRILSPVHVVLIVLVTAAIVSGGLSASARRAVVIVIALLVAAHAARAAQWAAGAPNSRHLGYASREWRTSPTMAAAKALPNDLTIFSNGVDAIYLRADRFARPLPKVTDPTKAAKDAKFRRYMNGLRDFLAQHGGYVVYFHNIPRAYVVTETQLLEMIPMELIQKLPDGAIYRRLPDAQGGAAKTAAQTTRSTHSSGPSAGTGTPATTEAGR